LTVVALCYKVLCVWQSIWWLQTGIVRMKFFQWLDSIRCLRMEVWDFSVRSLVREYGRDFMKRVILRHPIRTFRGIQHYRRSKKSNPSMDSRPIESTGLQKAREARRQITGVGFCLKPMNPACISGRGNHDCLYFEKALYRSPENIPDCCRECAIREIGALSLASGRCFYVMTSARDILYDLILPALESDEFARGLFVICRYSFDPFEIALRIAGIEGCLFPYEKNDCRDYPTWLLADIGTKNEQTEINFNVMQSIRNRFVPSNEDNSLPPSIVKKGHLFYPHD